MMVSLGVQGPGRCTTGRYGLLAAAGTAVDVRWAESKQRALIIVQCWSALPVDRGYWMKFVGSGFHLRSFARAQSRATRRSFTLGGRACVGQIVGREDGPPDSVRRAID